MIISTLEPSALTAAAQRKAGDDEAAKRKYKVGDRVEVRSDYSNTEYQPGRISMVFDGYCTVKMDTGEVKKRGNEMIRRAKK